MQNIRLVVTDLDGTLLGSDTSISEDAVQTVAELAEKNIRFTFITGRPYYAVKRFARQLTITAPIVTCNGAVLCDEERVLYRRSFPLANLEKLVRATVPKGFTVLMFQWDTEYSFSETGWTRRRKEAGRAVPIKKASTVDWAVETADKLNIIAEPGNTNFDSLLGLLDEVKDFYSVTMYGKQGCEIVAKGINKAVALQDLCKLLSIRENEVLAIGDNENDNEMLAVAGVGAAVGNAVPSTKSFANYLCTLPYTEGVVEAIRKIALYDEHYVRKGSD
ncbi:MAG: Cof-type HAD-IIB family hydrolase [Hungatella sp.]|jgi:Cof subfamily protein (haloacid dehalogenase superfamily)|nr:Cof-type HAD-IIB family hydrolase [Hungatella sp.]